MLEKTKPPRRMLSSPVFLLIVFCLATFGLSTPVRPEPRGVTAQALADSPSNGPALAWACDTGRIVGPRRSDEAPWPVFSPGKRV